MVEEDTTPKPKRRGILTAFKLCGLLVLVGFVLSRLDPEDIAKSWRGVSPGALLLLLSCFSASMLLRIAKWGWLAKRVGFSFGWFNLVRTYLNGHLLGLVTPLRVGEVYRTVALTLPPESTASRSGLATMAWLLERVYELVILLLLALVSLRVLFPQVQTTWLLVVLGLGGLLLVLPIPLPKALTKRLPTWLVHHVLAPMFQARDALGPGGCVVLLGMTLVTFALNLFGGWLIYQMFGALQAWDYLLRMPILILINNVPITIAGVGLRELGSMTLFAPLGYSASAAAVAATLLFVGVNIAALLAALPMELIHHVRQGRR